MTSQPNTTNPQWQKILDAALAGARDDAREQVGDAVCEAYSLGIVVGSERQSVQPAPRPVPTMAERFAGTRGCGHTTEQHRHDDGQAADARSQDRRIRELRRQLDDMTTTAAGFATERDDARIERDILARDHASAEQVATFRQGVIDQYRAELGAAGEVLAVVRDAQERVERALATYDTQPEVTPIEPDEALREALAEDHAVDALDDADEPDDLRSPLAVERDKLVETIGRLVSLPPEQIANMHEVGYSGISAGLGSPSPRAQDEPESEEVRWAYRWIGADGQVYDEMDASDNAIETAEQRAHRIAAKRLTGTVRGEVIRYRVLTMPAEVVATYPAEQQG